MKILVVIFVVACFRWPRAYGALSGETSRQIDGETVDDIRETFVPEEAATIYKNHEVRRDRRLAYILSGRTKRLSDKDVKELEEICEKAILKMGKNANMQKAVFTNVIIGTQVWEAVQCVTKVEESSFFVVNGPKDDFYFTATSTGKFYSNWNYVDIISCINIAN